MNLPEDYRVDLNALWEQWNGPERDGLLTPSVRYSDIQWLLELAFAARTYCACLEKLVGVHSMEDVAALNDAEAVITSLLVMDTSR